MNSFRIFLQEAAPPQGAKNIESLPLHQGHDGVVAMADMLHGVHRTLLGKKASIKTSVNLKGTPITFGVHPVQKKFFVSQGGLDNFSHDEIEYNYQHNPSLAKKMHSAFDNIQKVMPRQGGMYNGSLLYSDPSEMPSYLPKTNANIGLTVDTNDKGKMLTNATKAKFNVHPDVYMVNSELRSDPTKYSVDHQHNFLSHMEMAKKAYSKLNPEAFDIVKPHSAQLESYVRNAVETEQKPTVDGYAQHLLQTYGGKAQRADNMYDKDKRISKYSTLAQHLFDNKKDFEGVISLLGHLHNAKNVLSDVISNNNNPGDVTVYKGDNAAIIRRKKG